MKFVEPNLHSTIHAKAILSPDENACATLKKKSTSDQNWMFIELLALKKTSDRAFSKARANNEPSSRFHCKVSYKNYKKSVERPREDFV